ncbi:hypothetical protein L6452_41351 [Arctium lappa]|uniref:Uncharacterized protein n=1 Tax=Arctium lappa TaxID=4217 RepID=A0ACB8XSZ4_ARCLA|nr:hypothetical protein L6452_41351 [Arctium lappa]
MAVAGGDGGGRWRSLLSLSLYIYIYRYTYLYIYTLYIFPKIQTVSGVYSFCIIKSNFIKLQETTLKNEDDIIIQDDDNDMEVARFKQNNKFFLNY